MKDERRKKETCANIGQFASTWSLIVYMFHYFKDYGRQI